MTLGSRSKSPEAEESNKNDLPPFPARQMLVLGKLRNTRTAGWEHD